MKINRQKRKLIRVKAAADLLDVGKTKLYDLIYKEKRLSIASQAKPGTTSPIKLYQAQVEDLAREWGILN